MSRVLIIAEAGVNHNGNIEMAKGLIDVAANAKADFVKFQTWITENVISRGAPKAEYQKANDANEDQFNMAKNLELSFAQFRELKAHCLKRGIGFLSTAEEPLGLDFLVDELDMPILKIGSGELDNLIFLRQVARKNRDVILSTGMGTMAEVERAYQILQTNGAKSITILHCTSNYPAAFDSVNLKAMTAMGKAMNAPVGYSDHTLGIEVPIAAVALGATIIEKHFTLDKTQRGPDHAASLSPEELAIMVRQIRNIEFALAGDGVKKPQACEIEVMKVVRKGPYLARNMKSREALSECDLHFKRPVKEIRADQADEIIGKRLKADLPAGHCLEFSDFAL